MKPRQPKRRSLGAMALINRLFRRRVKPSGRLYRRRDKHPLREGLDK